MLLLLWLCRGHFCAVLFLCIVCAFIFLSHKGIFPALFRFSTSACAAVSRWSELRSLAGCFMFWAVCVLVPWLAQRNLHCFEECLGSRSLCYLRSAILYCYHAFCMLSSLLLRWPRSTIVRYVLVHMHIRAHYCVDCDPAFPDATCHFQVHSTNLRYLQGWHFLCTVIDIAW